MNDADIEFEISMLQGERCGATCALEGKARDAFLWSLWRREAGFPEVEGLVSKSHTIGVDIALGANFTDDADFGFAIGFERAENQLLLGNEFVTRHSWPLPQVAKMTDNVSEKEADGRGNVNASCLRGTGR